MLDFSSCYTSPRAAVLDKDLAKLGDALVNFIYSVAKSRVKGKPDAGKVPNSVLSDALHEAGMRGLAPSRVDRHMLGDVTEAIVAYAWIEGELDLEESIDIVSGSISGEDFEKRRFLLESTTNGFVDLLDLISKRINFGDE
ncbi:MAG: ribonuclease III family protein [Candidatus Hadarchaeia archaeon]